MRILYGVQGTGNGHLTRVRSLAPSLMAAGVEIDFLFSGRDRSKFFDMELFGEFQCRHGLSFSVHRGRIDIPGTLLGIRPFRLISDIRQLELKDYDLVISDFEPITAWAAKSQNKKCISMSHQGAFEYEVPKVRGYLSSRALIRHFAPGTVKLGFHYHHFNQPILPPLIGKQLAEPPAHNKIVVYMGFEELDDVIEFLRPFTNFHFEVFTHVNEKSREGHIVINPISHTEFHTQLRDASGVISNSGFALSSECLALGKKLLIKPLHGQFEQLSNSLALQTLGRATITDQLDHSILREWLTLSSHKPIPYPDLAPMLADWIVNDESHDVYKFSESVWNSFHFPFDYDAEFGSRILPGLVA